MTLFEVVAKIPAGKVTTYGALGKATRLHQRYVGRLLHTNTNSEATPCHRVVFSTGALAPAYAFGGAAVQQEKLESEGVEFEHGRVNLKKCLWQPPVAESVK